MYYTNLWHIFVLLISFLYQGVESYYLSKKAEKGIRFLIDFVEDEVSLDIPVGGKDLPCGWSLQPEVYPTKVSIQKYVQYQCIHCSPFQVSRESVDTYQAGFAVPACHVRLVWTKGKEHLKELSYMLPVSGMKPYTHIRVTRIPALQGQENCIPCQNTSEK